MTTNSVLKELETSADIDEAKRDLVLRFVRDQESLQTSQVDLKLVDDNTIDLIDSNLGKDENHNDTTTTSKDGATVASSREEGHLIAPRPPSGRPRSRRLQRKSSSENSMQRKSSNENQRKISLSRVHSHTGVVSTSGLENMPLAARMNSSNTVDRLVMSPPVNLAMERLTMSAGMDRITRPMSPPPVDQNTADLNSSWPQQEFLARKISNGRKYVLYSPDNHDDGRPLSTQSHKVVYHNSDRSRSSSPTKGKSSRSRARTFMNLNIEPVHPSEIPLLRGASASSSVGGPYTLVQLPPIQTTPPSI